MEGLIEKETLGDYQIVPAFVDKTEDWRKDLEYAARLGNEHKGKTAITFQTTRGPRTVETTVWSVTDRFITLKGGAAIPLHAVLEIHY